MTSIMTLGMMPGEHFWKWVHFSQRHKFPRTQGKGQTRGFVQKWFEQFDWLEYSVNKDAAYCFYCYLFKPPRANNFCNDAFTKVGFRNWKNGKEVFQGAFTIN
jgi:hypothetical protein